MSPHRNTDWRMSPSAPAYALITMVTIAAVAAAFICWVWP